MTVQNEAPAPTPGPTQPPARQMHPITFRLVSSVPLGALLSWAGGVAAHAGWHVSVPFLPAWLLFIVATYATGHFSGLVGAFWHYEKGRTAAQIAAQIKAVELLAQRAAPGLFKDLGL